MKRKESLDFGNRRFLARRFLIQAAHHLIGYSLNGRGNLHPSRSGEAWLHNKLTGKVNRLIDIGSNTGFYWKLVKSCNPAVQVIAVDPVAEFLEASRCSQADGVKFCEAFLSDRSGERFVLTRRKWGASVHAKSSLAQPWESFEVLSQTLDELLANFPQFQPDFIKIDTDGMDFKVLKGSIRTISSSRPIVQIECGKFWRDAFQPEEEFLQLLVGLRYEPFLLLPKGLMRVDSIDQMASHKYSLNLVLLPAGFWVPRGEVPKTKKVRALYQ